jgi:tetratricopeptide (TPR) repeat protein
LNIEQTLQVAVTHHKAGEVEDAERWYRFILNEQSQHSDANHNLGVLLKQDNKADVALAFFKAALESNPGQGQFWISYIDTLIHLKQYNVAQKILRQGQSKGLKGNVVDELEARINSRYEIISSPTKAQIDSISRLYFNGQIQDALNALDFLIPKYPQEALLYNLSGVCHKALGQLDVAVLDFERALMINSDYADVYNNLGNVLRYLGQLDKAALNFERALTINPDYAEAHYNFGNVLRDLGQLESAVKRYERALAIKPDYAAAHNNLGAIFQEFGQLEDAVRCYEQTLVINPDYAEAHNNLGNILKELGQLEAAVTSYKRALTINPDFADAHNNFGTVLRDLGQLEFAVKHYERALAINPDDFKAHNNLANVLKDLGQLESAVKHYEWAIQIQSDYGLAWNNLFFVAKALELDSTLHSVWIDSYKAQLDEAILSGVNFRILEYRLNAFTPHTVDDCFNDTINALPLISHEEIQNPLPIYQNKELPFISDNMIALMHFGRSGTGLLHSLIDNHPEISTLPSIYFSEYYNADVWGKLIAQGWDQLPENFIKKFAVLFDARSSVPVPSIDTSIVNLGQQEGMVNVGGNRDEVLTVDENTFCAELQNLMSGCSKLNPRTFFTLVHIAYEKVLGKKADKHMIFYHIHNPSPYAELNFLRYNPEVRLVMMVREPVQSCESWVKKVIKESSEKVHNRIVTMLFDIDQIAFRKQESIGVRLEDLKSHPKETIEAICDWMAIEEEPSLYEMTAQGKKWWGDPSSPDYSPQGMSPFDNSAITRKVGSVFNKQDQFILRTLFYPFRVRFGYTDANPDQFKVDLKSIKPLLDEPFGFQEQLAENLNQDLETITRSGSALYFRAALHDRWKVLDEFNTFPNMLKPLKI